MSPSLEAEDSLPGDPAARGFLALVVASSVSSIASKSIGDAGRAMFTASSTVCEVGEASFLARRGPKAAFTGEPVVLMGGFPEGFPDILASEFA